MKDGLLNKRDIAQLMWAFRLPLWMQVCYWVSKQVMRLRLIVIAYLAFGRHVMIRTNDETSSLDECGLDIYTAGGHLGTLFCEYMADSDGHDRMLIYWLDSDENEICDDELCHPLDTPIWTTAQCLKFLCSN